MEQKSTIICPHCGAKLEVSLSEPQQPTPDPTPPHDDEAKIIPFSEMLQQFNEVLTRQGYRPADSTTMLYAYLSWAYNYADNAYRTDAWMMRDETYPLVFNYHGSDTTNWQTAYNAMQAWLMALILAELAADWGEDTNTQTELLKRAYIIGDNCCYPLYNGKTLKADPYAMREAAGYIYAICRSDSNIASQIDIYRSELGSRPIEADRWNDLGYENEMLTDAEGRRGYRTTRLGYCINTSIFLPSAPGPRIEGTTVCDLPLPSDEGQAEMLFNPATDNYHMDEIINDMMVRDWNMMSATPLTEWDSYPREKQNRLVNVAAIPPCTYMYMFGAPIRVRFDGIQTKCYDGKTTAKYYTFSETTEDTGLALDGPFSNLAGIYRYNIPSSQRTPREQFIEAVSELADNLRFPTQDPNYGRCRPGCKPTREGGELNPMHGAKENEIYNVDLTTMVADCATQKINMSREDGFAQDSPRSYVSGHSAQIVCLAMLLTQMDEDSTDRPQAWARRAFEYSVSRSVGRFHWNSDCIYGRLFGTMALPIINAMTGMRSGYEAMRQYVQEEEPAPTPTPTGDWSANVILKNDTGHNVQTTGEVRLYISVDGERVGINTYLPGAFEAASALYTLAQGENEFCDMGIHCKVNGGYQMLNTYDGRPITECRFYDERHWNNIDAGYQATLDTNDPRCSSVISKAGATYVIRITNL